MRIEKIILKDYRQFRNLEILFDKIGSKDLHIIIGSNGTGKTNVLNAINWCLYGDEPNVSKDSQLLPMVNLNTLQETNVNKLHKIMIEIWAKGENERTFVFRREALCKLNSADNKLFYEPGNFEVEISDEDGDSELFEDDRATPHVNRFVPERIREFFFFDGERLDRYFREATGQNIRYAVFEIAQIDLLEKMEKRFGDILRDLRREAGQKNPQIDKVRLELEKWEASLKEVTVQTEECNRQIVLAKEKIKEYNEKLSGTPDIELLENDREKLIVNKKSKKERRNKKAIERQEILFYYGTLIMLWECIQDAIDTIELKKKNKELPPTHDKTLIEKTLTESICALCGRPLESVSKSKISDIVKSANILAPEIASCLLHMDGSLYRFKDDFKSFLSKLNYITQELESYEKDLLEIESELAKIDKELSNYDANQIKEWHVERKRFEQVQDINMKKLGSLELKKSAVNSGIVKLTKQLEEEMQKEKKLGTIKEQIIFCEKALAVVSVTKQQIMEETKEEIRSQTKKLFFELSWKKETFKDVTIDDSYNLNLIHYMGYECLGSLSAAERELLALSFTLALHKVSGFDSPIIIDTPVARVSDKHRENFGKVFSEISEDKQIILLFTPSEYTDDISRHLNSLSSNRYSMKLCANEKETKLEVL